MVEANETPCPVEGLLCPTKGPSFMSLVERVLIVYRVKPLIGITVESPKAYTLRLGCSSTLEAVHTRIREAFKPELAGVESFVVCCNDTNEPITLHHLHAGKDVVAYLDTNRHQNLSRETLNVPAGPTPSLFSKNYADLRPFICSAHLRLMHEHGPIFRMTLPPNTDAVVICDPELTAQVIENPSVWQKTHFKHSQVVRGFVGRGVFTADDDEEIWGIAHRILLPAFSNQGMKLYFHLVLECVDRLFKEWDRLVSTSQPINLTRSTERFTFDVIGRVGFGYDFKALETGTHPYLEQIHLSSEYSDARWQQSFFQSVLTESSFLRNWCALNEPNIKFVERIVAERLAELEKGIRVQEKDILTLMLTTKDPQTGEKLPPDNVRDQILTFLLAGHDSTSTALTVLFMLLSQHGDVERKVLEEVERVVGSEPLTFEKLGRLQYCTCVINESLRLFPPAQATRKDAAEDTMLGPYKISKGTASIVSLWGLAHNPEYWPDPWRFDPDRWLPEKAKGRNSYASIPFSVGHRGCLGRQLSIMEQRCMLAMTVQRYHLRLHSLSKPSFTTPLFLKPHNIFLSLERRACSRLQTQEAKSPLTSAVGDENARLNRGARAKRQISTDKASVPFNTRLVILYGSNMGTCETFAGELALHAVNLGMTSDLMSLDSFLDKTDVVNGCAAVIVICATYNGTPPDNAAKFISLLEKEPDKVAEIFTDTPFTVFGCGNSQWVRTYQSIPRFIDKTLAAAQGKRLTANFLYGDADSTLDDDFQAWKFAMWEGLSDSLGMSGASMKPDDGAAGLEPAYVVTPCQAQEKLEAEKRIGEIRSKWAIQNGLFLGKVLKNKELQSANSDRSTHHVEIELAGAQKYSAGDHLAVQGGNPLEVVRQAAKVLGLELSDMFHIRKASLEAVSSSIIPEGAKLSVEMILMWCVELQQTMSKAQLAILMDRASCPYEKKALEAMRNAYNVEVVKSKRTLIEVLDTYNSVQVTLAELLTLLPPLRPRYYSISSSPLATAGHVSVTVGVVRGDSPAGRLHLGVASNFLASRKVGQLVGCFVKDTKSNFRLPAAGDVPVILVGPGTGVAPFRGFLYDREASKATGTAVLFFGCRNDDDFIYREELEGFKERGVLKDMHVAFSRKLSGRKVYVQHLIEQQSEEMLKMLEAGAYIYVCGDAKHMAPDVRKAFAKILAEGKGLPLSEGDALIDELTIQKRYIEDVWASG